VTAASEVRVAAAMLIQPFTGTTLGEKTRVHQQFLRRFATSQGFVANSRMETPVDSAARINDMLRRPAMPHHHCAGSIQCCRSHSVVAVAAVSSLWPQGTIRDSGIERSVSSSGFTLTAHCGGEIIGDFARIGGHPMI